MANSGVALSWIAWFIAHVDKINGILQFFALLLAMGASVSAIVYHRRNRNPKQ